MKKRGRPCAVAGTTNPGEKAATRGNRSPLARASEIAYDAPSEKPPTATRDGSTATRANTHSRARSRNAMSSPNVPRMASQVPSRESGASTATPVSSAIGPTRRSMPAPAWVAPCRKTISGSGPSGALAGRCRIASRPRAKPSAPLAAEVATPVRGRAVSLAPSRPSAGRVAARQPSLNVTPSAARLLFTPKRRRLIFTSLTLTEDVVPRKDELRTSATNGDI